METLPGRTLEAARALFPHIAQGKIYLDHAGTSPLSTRVVGAITAYMEERSRGRLDTYPLDLLMVAECRAMLQRVVNAESPERIAFAGSTTDAINIVASGLRWKSGDRIILGDIEFPANVYPFLNLRRLGVELDVLHAPDGSMTPEMIAGALAPRTRLVALSAVQYLSGYRADLAAIGEMTRRRGIVFAVDGIQAAGAVRLDVQEMKIDALAAGGQKWLMAPHGSAFLYLTEELQSRIEQANLGWLSVETPWDFHNFTQPLASSARRYECGSLNTPGLWGLHASLMTLLEFDPAATEAHLLAITGTLMSELRLIPEVRIISPAATRERAGIVTVEADATFDLKLLLKRMAERRITIALRRGLLRFSPHFYNSPEDMVTAAGALRDCLRAGSG